MSVEPAVRQAVIALAGNPNSGKTSLFNALTGARQKVANYPGVTVERVSGSFELSGQTVEVLDVPGLYSLRAISADEQVAAETLAESVDLVVVAVDAANLERNLFLYSQIAELGKPMVVALTMTDLPGAQVDVSALGDALGVPVVGVVSPKGVGLDSLKAAIAAGLGQPAAPRPVLGYPEVVGAAVEGVHERLARAGIDADREALRRSLLDPDAQTMPDLSHLPELREALEEGRRQLGVPGKTLDTQTRYAWAASVRKRVSLGQPRQAWHVSDRIDRMLTHRFWGLLVFVAVMYAGFQAIYTLAAPLMDLIDTGINSLAELVSPPLAGMPAVQSLVADGIVRGVGSAIIFLPQIMILFLFIALLEGSGYLARASFLMDRLFGWCGLNGRAFIPLLSSFACAIPGVMAARVMPDARSRLATALIAPLMSCSARLPVYVLVIGAFIEPRFGAGWAGFALFAMHFVGLLVAAPVAFILNRGILKGRRLPFVLELPPYRWPRLKDVALTVGLRAVVFLQTAGTLIVALSIVIWALLYFPRGDEAAFEAEYRQLGPGVERSLEGYVASRQLEESFLGQFGRFVEPVFAPAGFDWRISTAILAAFPAREVVVPALGILFELSGEVDESSGDLREALVRAEKADGSPLLTPWSAVGLMLFFALCCQCMATLAVIRRETNSWKWAAFAFIYMTTLAYLAAVGAEMLGRLLG